MSTILKHRVKIKTAILLIVIMTIILITGCETGNDEISKTRKNQDIELTTGFDNEIILAKNHYNDFHLDGLHLVRWENYIQEKYDIQLDVVNIRGAYNNFNIEQLEERTELDGLVYVNSIEELRQLWQAGVLLPVTDYIGSIPQYAAAEDWVFECITDDNDEMWAFTTTGGRFIHQGRYYNNEWLRDAGMEVPKTPDEFYRYAEFLRTLEVPGNEHKEVYIADANINIIITELPDVFRAFGCYPGGDQNLVGPIGYNPEKGSFESVFDNEGFIEAMKFIKSMYDNDLFKVYRPSAKNNVEYLLGSEIKRSESIESYYNGWDIGLYLQGTNESNLFEIENDFGGGVAVMKNTTNVEGKLKRLFDCFTYDDALNDFLYGEKGLQYEVVDGDTRFTGESMMGLLFLVEYLDLELDERMTSANERLAGRDNSEFTTDDLWSLYTVRTVEALKTDLGYSLPYTAASADLYMLNAELIPDMWEFTSRILLYDVPVEDAVEAIKTQLALKNIPRRIEALNNGSFVPQSRPTRPPE